MVMAVNGNDRKFWTKLDFQKKTGKMKLRRKRSWQDLKKKKVVCKTALRVRGQKTLFDMVPWVKEQNHTEKCNI